MPPVRRSQIEAHEIHRVMGKRYACRLICAVIRGDNKSGSGLELVTCQPRSDTLTITLPRRSGQEVVERRKSKDIVDVLRMKSYYDPDLQANFDDSVASDDRAFGVSTPSTGRNDDTGPTARSKSKALRQTR
ncbi:hypothetical protein TNCV_1896491 [Trichonephila clavipes]|nr:hypothetical protein TNCV_1896491 [Trichonephila clavipes]